MYPYVREKHLPFILLVSSDWLRSRDPGITELIIQRLENAERTTYAALPLKRAVSWALEAERQAYSSSAASAPMQVPDHRPVPE